MRAVRRGSVDHHLRALVPGKAVAVKRLGIEAIYLGGWAASAKGSRQEDPDADLASYPLGQVPDEVAPLAAFSLPPIATGISCTHE